MHYEFTSSNDTPMGCHVVLEGQRYGRPDDDGVRPLVAEGHLVEFYDRRHDHDPEHKAQFVSRYFVSTILEKDRGGLMLDVGTPAWDLDAVDMSRVRRFLKTKFDLVLTVKPKVGVVL